MGLARSFQVIVLALASASAFAAAAADVPPVAPAATPAPSSAHPPHVAAVRLAGTLGIDVGFTDLLKVEMSDGSTRSIAANQGMFISVGAAFLPVLGGRLETQATLGVKYWDLDASNGSASFIAFPVEILEAFHASPLRFAVGLEYLFRPKTSGDGVLSDFDVRFDDSLGFVLEADWTWRARPGAPLVAIGPRFIWQRLQVSGGGNVVDANALGVVVSFTGG